MSKYLQTIENCRLTLARDMPAKKYFVYMQIFKLWIRRKISYCTFYMKVRPYLQENDVVVHTRLMTAISSYCEGILHEPMTLSSSRIAAKRIKARWIINTSLPKVFHKVIPEIGFFKIRILHIAWENNVLCEDENVAWLMKAAYQQFIKNILTSIIEFRKGGDHSCEAEKSSFKNSHTKQMPNDESGHQAKKIKLDDLSGYQAKKVKVNDESGDQPNKSSNKCSDSCKHHFITINDLFAVIQVRPNLIKSNTLLKSCYEHIISACEASIQ